MAASALRVGEQLQALLRLYRLPGEMAVDLLQSALELPVGVGLPEAPDRDAGGLRVGVAGREQGRDPFFLGGAGQIDAVLLAAQPNVAEHQIDLLALQHLDRFVEAVDGRDHLIAGLAEHRFIVECRQRFVLDDEDTLDDTVTLPEQHETPTKRYVLKSERTKAGGVPRPRRSARGARPEVRDEGPQRIAKLLARAGVASRREVERMIAEGRIALDGEKLTTPATLLDSLNGVTVDGRPVRPPAAAQLFRFYKPLATLTAESDPKGRRTIYDVLPKGGPRLIPVGRLDFMTEGLLLMTNDGGLKRQLELPKTGVVRTYRARAFGTITQAQLEELAEGVTIEGMRYGSINANLERRTGRNCWIELSLTEGKNREVRRVLEHLGLQVSRLIRTAYGPFDLAGLEPGGIAEVDRGQMFEFRRTL